MLGSLGLATQAKRWWQGEAVRDNMERAKISNYIAVTQECGSELGGKPYIIPRSEPITNSC